MFSTVIFWFGIILLVDSSIGLLFQERWQKFTGLNIQKIALYEVVVGLLLIVAHFALETVK